jgi:hypothetical protein
MNCNYQRHRNIRLEFQCASRILDMAQCSNDDTPIVGYASETRLQLDHSHAERHSDLWQRLMGVARRRITRGGTGIRARPLALSRRALI